MNSQITADHFVSILHRTMQNEIEAIAQIEIDKVHKVIEAEIRKRVALIAIQVAKYADVQYMQDRVIVTVQFDKAFKP